MRDKSANANAYVTAKGLTAPVLELHNESLQHCANNTLEEIPYGVNL